MITNRFEDILKMSIELHPSWNKAMDPMKKNHPGAVTAISVNPADPSKVYT